jgi:hypothetical protein
MAFSARGWSFASLDAAKQDAIERAKQVFEIFARGDKPKEYEYLDRPICEEIIETLGPAEAPFAHVTRNRYGALVLNSAKVLFVDIDFPEAKGGGLFESLALAFSKAKRDAKRRAVIQEAVDAVARWAQQNPARAFRLYRTQAGLRALFTDKLYEPNSEETATILRELNADAMYVRLTRKQECFRARLTAKPWRCGCKRPPGSYPWPDDAAMDAYRAWEADYMKRDAAHRVCDLIRAVGEPADLAEVRAVVETHDRMTRIDSKALLA